MELIPPSLSDSNSSDDSKEHKTTVFDYINMLSYSKEIPTFDSNFEKEYNQYVVNFYFSLHEDTVMIVNELQLYNQLSNKHHFLFLHNTVPKRKRRYVQWYKHEKVNAEIDLIAEIYNVNINRAFQLRKLFDKEKIKLLYKTQQRGGLK